MQNRRATRWAAVVAAAALSAVSAPAAAQPVTTPRAAQPPRCDGAGDIRPGVTAVRTVVSGDRTRSYRIHVPQNSDGRTPLPVVVAYHGRGSTGAELQEYSGLSDLPAITVFPEGVVGTGGGERQAWQGAPYATSGVDDVAFTRALLDDIERRACVDRDRIYATGKSNGGGLVNLLACRLPDRFAAIAPVAAAVYPGANTGCGGAAPKPVLIMHGDADATIPYSGDADRGLPAVESWAGQWAARASCAAAPRTENLAEDVALTRYRGCGNTPVEVITVRGGGHTWPGALAYSGGGYATQSVRATALAWSFFQNKRLAPSNGGIR